MHETREGIALRELLPERFDDLDEAMDRGFKDAGAPAQSSLAWRFVRRAAADELQRVLDGDLFEVIAQAWAKLGVLREAAAQPGSRTQVVHLGKHDFTLPLHPVLSIDFGLPVPIELRFTLELTARIDSAAITVRRGHIVAVGSGDSRVTAQLKYRDTPLGRGAESPAVKLPGFYRLQAPGIAIA